jgi:hypothetical protein
VGVAVGVLSSRRCGEAGRPTQLLAGPTEGKGDKGDDLPERKTTVALSRIGSGEG